MPYENIYQVSKISSDACSVLGVEHKYLILQHDHVPVIETTFHNPNVHIQDDRVSTNHKQEIILYLYGAFNPIHLGHVKALDACRKWISDTKDLTVCAAVIGLASDKNVQYKFSNSGEICIPFSHRKRLCELACSNYPDMTVWPFPGNGQMELGEMLRKALNKPKATMGILLGSDHSLKPGYTFTDIRGQNMAVFYVGRDGMSTDDKILFKKWMNNNTKDLQIINIVPTKENNISSTAIRRKLKRVKVDYARDGTMYTNIPTILDDMVRREWITRAEGDYIYQNFFHLHALHEGLVFSTCREVQLNKQFY